MSLLQHRLQKTEVNEAFSDPPAKPLQITRSCRLSPEHWSQKEQRRGWNVETSQTPQNNSAQRRPFLGEMSMRHFYLRMDKKFIYFLNARQWKSSEFPKNSKSVATNALLSCSDTRNFVSLMAYSCSQCQTQTHQSKNNEFKALLISTQLPIRFNTREASQLFSQSQELFDPINFSSVSWTLQTSHKAMTVTLHGKIFFSIQLFLHCSFSLNKSAKHWKRHILEQLEWTTHTSPQSLSLPGINCLSHVWSQLRYKPPRIPGSKLWPCYRGSYWT